MTAGPDDAEAAVARRLRELRRISGRSQGDIAARMAARGWPWTQGTVSKIETGARVLRLAELADAAAVLGVPPMTLLSAGEFEETARERSAIEREVREQIASEILAGRCETGAS